MKIGMIKIGVLGCILFLCNTAHAQNQSQPSSSGALDAVLAIEEPTERITALQKFLKTSTVPEQSQRAREAIVESWAQLAEVQLGQNNIEKATVNFRKALTALPEKITDRFFGEAVIRIPIAVSLRGYRGEAIGLAHSLEKRFAKEPSRLIALGEFYMNIEASTDAIRMLEAAAKFDNEDARIHRLLGSAYRMGLRLDDAVLEFQQAIKIDPNEKRAYDELANLYRAHRAYDDAIKLYRKQLEIDPKHLPSYKGLALAYLAQGNEVRSTEALNQVRELRGAAEEVARDIYLQTQMSFYYLVQRKLKQARAAAEAALQVEPRYAWARIAAAEVDLAEGKYFEAERNLLAAQRYANFTTLFFTLGKLYAAVEDFDGAVDQLSKAFTYTQQNQFAAKLGGVLDLRTDTLKELLSREHQAAIFLGDPPTSDEQFKMIESLVRFNVRLRALKSTPTGRASNSGSAIGRLQLEVLDQAATDFIDAEKTRRSFRALYVAQQLAQAGLALGRAIENADLALGLAAIAIEPEGSLRDYPNYDRDGRLRIFRGRALDAKGWALFKAGRNEEAIAVLSESAQTYGPLPEGKRALWHLATVKETIGEYREALDLYIAGYEPPESTTNTDVNRAVIELLYRKVNGSLEGLDDRLRRAATASGTELGTLLASLRPVAGDQSKARSSKIEPGEKPASPVTQAREKKDPQFKLTFPPSLTPRDRDSASPATPPLTLSRTEPKIAIPRSDPMFAKPSERQPSDTKPPDSSNGPAATTKPEPEPTPIISTPVVLPNLTSVLALSVPLSSMIDQRKLFKLWEYIVMSVEEEQPPAPPAAQILPQEEMNIRKRRVTTGDEVSSEPVRPRTTGGTRKRRVTVPDSLPRNR